VTGEAAGALHRVAILLHGWEGSAEATYVLSLGSLLLSHGFDVVRLNLRDHGATHHLNREIFHSCRLPEWSAPCARSHGASRLHDCIWPAFRSAAISCCGWRPTRARLVQSRARSRSRR